MKTKFYLTVVGLSALSVACTNEDMLVDNMANNNTDRPVVDVRVNAEFPVESNDVESRKVPGENGKFLWETKTDQLGAVRVDGTTRYMVGTSHFSNAKFTIVDQTKETASSASFTTNNTLAVGSYLFYYPYSSAMTTTDKGVLFNLSTVQEYDSDASKMLDNDFQISPIIDVAGYEEGTLELPIKMRSIYAYGKLNLVLGEDTKIAGTGDALTSLEIQKVILKAGTGESFIVSGTIAQSTLAGTGRASAYQGTTEDAITTKMATQFDWIGVETDKHGKYFAALDTIFAEHKADSYAESEATNYLTAAVSNGTASALSINYLAEGTSTGQTLAAGSVLTTRFLIPAAKYSEDMTLEVYTNKGVFTKTIEADATNGIVAKRGFTFNLANPNRVTGVAEDIEIGRLDPPAGTISIVSKYDFLATMKQYSTAVAGTNVAVAFLNTKVDADMVAAIPANVTLNIESDVTFEGNMTLKNIKVLGQKTATFNGVIALGEGFKFTGNTVVAGGTLTLAKTITGAAEKTTTVNTGAVLTLPNNTLAYESDINVAGGTLNIGTAPAADSDGLILGLNTLSAGIINVNVPVTLTKIVTVGSDVEDAPTATLNVNANVVNSTYTITANKSAIVTNNATLTLSANGGSVLNNEDAVLVVTTNTGTVTNNAGATATVTTNRGTVNNSGALTSTNNTGVNADALAVIEQKAANAVLYLASNNAYGKVITCADSETQVDGNAANAEIVYIDGCLFSLNTTKLGAVSYVVNDWDGTLPHKEINTLKINNAFTLASDAAGDVLATMFNVPVQLTAIDFVSTATFNRPVTIASTQAINWGGDVTFGENATIAGTMDFYGNVELKGGTNTVADGSTLIFNGEKKLNGNAITCTGGLNLTSNNGRLTINNNITTTGDLTVTYGAADTENGIVAGSIWNNAVVTVSNESTVNANTAWKGNKAE